MNSYRIPEIASKYLEHDMIQKHTDLPHFPDFRSRLLYAFLDKHSVLAKQSELFTLVTSLVQIGMDTHDMVSVISPVTATHPPNGASATVMPKIMWHAQVNRFV